MKARDIMTREVWFATPYANLETIAAIMWNRNCGAVPVVDQEGRPISILTDRDLTMATALTHRPLSDISAGEVNTGEIVVCSEDDDVSEVLKRMSANAVRRVVVVGGTNQVVVGMLSLDDMVTYAERARRGQARPALSFDDVILGSKSVIAGQLLEEGEEVSEALDAGVSEHTEPARPQVSERRLSPSVLLTTGILLGVFASLGWFLSRR